MSMWNEELVKSLFDGMVCLILIIVSAPLCLVIAILIMLESRGPVLFVQTALGKGCQPFPMYKFRTMHVNSDGTDHQKAVFENLMYQKPATFDENGQPIYKTAMMDDRRITRVGKYLRRTSLDEFPQFLNVLRGEMSLVGPRPALPYEAALYTERQRERFLVKPGITGLYQVTARNRVPIEEMIRIDLEYIRRRSFWYDLWILIQTPRAMLYGL